MLRKSLSVLSVLGLSSVLFSSCVFAVGTDGHDWDDDGVSYGVQNSARRSYESPLRIAERNRQAMEELQPGMAEEEVQAILTRDAWATGSRNTIANPHRRESFALGDGTRVVVLYYYTDTTTSDGLIREDELSPVWFEEGQLVGWGRAGFDTWSARASSR